MSKYSFTVLAGDGVGPEVTAQAVRCLQAVAERYGHQFSFDPQLIGGAAIDATGDPLPEATLESCQHTDAMLLGAVGTPKYSSADAPIRPEQGLLRLRKSLQLFANLRPVVPHPSLRDASPLKPALLNDVDIMVVRELTGGIYFGERVETETYASDVCAYTVEEIERIVRVAADLAMARSRKLTSVDKANVLATSRLWRSTCERIVRNDYPDLELEHVLIDAATMHLISRPRDFDVMVLENMFGDIITDEASMLAGSMGLLPSASLGDGGRGLYEPIHGSAPDIAGDGIANPLGTILSAAMALRHPLGLQAEALALEAAVGATLDDGVFTVDLAAGGASVNTEQAGSAVIARLQV